MDETRMRPLTSEQRAEIERLTALTNVLHRGYTMAGQSARVALEESACDDVPTLLDIIDTLLNELEAVNAAHVQAETEGHELRDKNAALIGAANYAFSQSAKHTVDGEVPAYLNPLMDLVYPPEQEAD